MRKNREEWQDIADKLDSVGDQLASGPDKDYYGLAERIHSNLEATQYSADPDLEIPLNKLDEARIAIALAQPDEGYGDMSRAIPWRIAKYLFC
jgi:hypothetical protein